MSKTNIKNPLADMQLVVFGEGDTEEEGIILTLHGDDGDIVEVELTNRNCLDVLVNGVVWMGQMSDVLFEEGMESAIAFSDELSGGELTESMKFTDAFYKYLEDK